MRKKRRQTNIQVLNAQLKNVDIGKGVEIDPDTHTIKTTNKTREVEKIDPTTDKKPKKIPYINTRVLLTKR